MSVGTSRWQKALLLGTLLAYSAVPAAAGILYNQPFDGSGNGYASQNDTTGGNGNFATMYDSFSLIGNANIDEVRWTGAYFNPPTLSPIASFTVTFWSDAGGPSTSLLTSTVAGTSNEVLLGTFGGLPAYEYSMTLLSPFAASAGTTYWLSIVPDLGFPPQWGVSGATGGDGSSVQDFFGTRSVITSDLAFGLYSNDVAPVPEPYSFGLAASGLGVLGFAAWRRKRSV